MTTLLKPFLVRKELLKRNLRVFSPREFVRVFHATPFQAKYFLEAYTKQGLFLRLKRGLYALQDALPSEEEIANLLYRPSYLSFEYALAVYHVLPDMVYEITSATTKPTRTFIAADKSFIYLTIKQEAFTGYMPAARDSRTILLAEPEKALVDYFYFVALGKKPNNDRLNFASLNPQKIRQYASLYQRPKLDQLIRDMI
jgi:predicted transcriptional regulator of viral defense system